MDTEAQRKWILGETLPCVNFQMGQWVKVVSGPDKGLRGALISLYNIDPEPEYHLETEEEGGDVYVLQSNITPAAPGAG